METSLVGLECLVRGWGVETEVGYDYLTFIKVLTIPIPQYAQVSTFPTVQLTPMSM